MKALQEAAQEIFDRKGFNILGLDLRGQSTMTDYYLIAEGSVDRHVKALASSITDRLEKLGIKAAHVEGEAIGDWIVIDYVDFIIHLFTPATREKYKLEQLWNQSKIVDLKISVENSPVNNNNRV